MVVGDDNDRHLLSGKLDRCNPGVPQGGAKSVDHLVTVFPSVVTTHDHGTVWREGSSYQDVADPGRLPMGQDLMSEAIGRQAEPCLAVHNSLEGTTNGQGKLLEHRTAHTSHAAHKYSSTRLLFD